MTRFAHWVAIDWSGAKGARQPGIAVAVASTDGAPALVRGDGVWSRAAVRDWLLNDLPGDSLVGLDLGMSLPFDDAGAFFPGWDDSPPDARGLWALVDRMCAHEGNLGVDAFLQHPVARRYFRHQGHPLHTAFGERPGGRLRVTEAGQREAGLNPYSNMNLVGAAQVGKSSLTGMRLLHALSGRLSIWPFDPLPAKGSVLVEIYTTLAAVRAGRAKNRSKMRDVASLNAALTALGCPPVAIDAVNDHQADALLTAAWLRVASQDSNLFAPHGLERIRATEGWTWGLD